MIRFLISANSIRSSSATARPKRMMDTWEDSETPAPSCHQQGGISGNFQQKFTFLHQEITAL